MRSVSEGWKLAYCVAPSTHHPDVASVEGHTLEIHPSHRIGADHRARAVQQLGDTVAAIRHPDVGSVEGYTLGIASHRIGADHRARAVQQLGDTVAAIRHPDVGSVEGYTLRIASHRIGAYHGTAARQQLGDAAAAAVRHPDVGSVEGHTAEAYICDMGRQISHLLGTTGMLLVMLLWLSLLNPARADRLVDALAGPQHEYKIVLGAALLSTVFSFIAAIRGSKWWYIGMAFSSGTLAFFTYSLSV